MGSHQTPSGTTATRAKEALLVASDLIRRKVVRQTGTERLRDRGRDLGVDLLSFWQWSVSDLVSNVTRGRLAEFIVARALGVPTDGVRDEWAPFDLITPAGLKIEVKSAAFVQRWCQVRLSPISFRTPATLAWDPETNVQSAESRRQADVYVFALLRHADKGTIDPLEVDQWRFYVLPTSELNARARSQHSITLRTLEKHCQHCATFSELPAAVAKAAAAAGLPSPRPEGDCQAA
jgi:hypothetical protein